MGTLCTQNTRRIYVRRVLSQSAGHDFGKKRPTCLLPRYLLCCISLNQFVLSVFLFFLLFFPFIQLFALSIGKVYTIG